MQSEKKFRFIFVLSIVVLVALCSCDGEAGQIDNTSSDVVDSKKWMSLIDDSVKLFSLNIPGTHDSCAMYDFALMESTSANQNLTLEQQLELGVRMIDIRPYHEQDGSYSIHHGVVYQHISYDDVLEICYEFLRENPSETILFAYYNENRSYDEYENIISCVMSGIESNPEYWLYEQEEERSKLSTEITLGEARGKIVLIKRFTEYESAFGLCERTDFHYVEPGASSYLEDAWADRFNMLEYVREGNNTEYGSLWLSGYFSGSLGIPNIKKMTDYINPKFVNYLDDLDKSQEYHFGMMVLDQITDEIIRKIFSLNFPVCN